MITAEELGEIVGQINIVGLSESLVVTLRQAWPGIHFTYCSEDDVPARLKPVVVGQGYGVYLASNSEHCVAFTNHLEAATGLVLAANSEE